MNFIIDAFIFDYFDSLRAQLGVKSHQNHQKVKNVRKKRGPILETFWDIFNQKMNLKSDFVSVSISNGFWGFRSSFWCQFDNFSVGSLALADHAFSITIPCEINVFGSRKA